MLADGRPEEELDALRGAAAPPATREAHG